MIPTQIWRLEGGIHLLELRFKNRLKNVELKLNKEILFDLKLKGHKTVYPFQLGDQTYTLLLKKIPVGGYEAHLIDEHKNKLPCKSNRPKNFGKPRRHWDKIVPFVGYGIAIAWIVLIIILSIKVFIIRS